MKNGKVLVFDMGGTKIASAVASMRGSDYELLDYKKCETPRSREEIVAKIMELFDFYQSRHHFKRIGFALAGQISAKGDTVISAPNIAGIDDFKLGKIIEEKTGCRVTLRNDVRCFALGEDRFGRYRGYDNAIFIAFGTGVGGAIKLNGKFYFGKDNIAGEFGHMVVVEGGELCGCGRKGCWEKYVSGAGLEKMYEKAYVEKKSAKDIVRDGLLGREKEKMMIAKLSSYLAAGFANLVNVLDPEIVIIGGSMANEKELLQMTLPLIRREVLPAARKLKINKSSLGYKAFLLGAATE